jgi:hypothetical protein
MSRAVVDWKIRFRHGEGASARLYRWVITLEGRLIRKGTAPGRDEAADAVSWALEELLL